MPHLKLYNMLMALQLVPKCIQGDSVVRKHSLFQKLLMFLKIFFT